jgi:hypothetical protein
LSGTQQQPDRTTLRAACAVIAMTATLASGCASLSDHGTPADIPPPPLQMIAAGTLELPRNCELRDGVIYRTDFVVQRDGRVADVQPEPAPACLQAALTVWVNSFQYSPPGETVPTVIDWMAVTARRGD